MRVSLTRWVERWWAGEAGWFGGVLSLALLPTEIAYRLVIALRRIGYDHSILDIGRAEVPVISVGNISVGGTGKTPVTRWLVGELLRRGMRPAVLHGGYGWDEPALHRQWYPEVPVLVGRDRRESARRGIEGGAGILILDDGFQHRRLARDLDLVLVAAEGWSAGLRLLPRGPWREPLSSLARAQVVAVTRKTASSEEARSVLEGLRQYAPTAARVLIDLHPTSWSPTQPVGEVLAVTAIARPELFVENARSAGANIVETLTFPDHHDYGAADLDRIRGAAAGRAVVTTSKDMVKLRHLTSELDLHILDQGVTIEEGAEFLSSYLDRLAAGSWAGSR